MARFEPPERAVLRTLVAAPHRRVRLPRRSHRAAIADESRPPLADDEVLRCGDLTLDVAAHQAFVGDTVLPLSHLQFVLLAHLVRNADRVVPAGELVGVVAEVGPTRPRTIASAVSRLRSHLGRGPQRPVIAVSRSRGYQLRRPAAPADLA